jgi:hypothetical protein
MLAPHYFLCTQPWYACILSWQVAGWSGAAAQGRSLLDSMGRCWVLVALLPDLSCALWAAARQTCSDHGSTCAGGGNVLGRRFYGRLCDSGRCDPHYLYTQPHG